MKKIFSLLLVTALLLSMSVVSLAAEITTDNTSQNVTVTYGASQSFTVTIPSSINIDDTGLYETKVIATDVLIPYGSSLNVAISSPNADGTDWYLVDVAEDSNTLSYQIFTDEAGEFAATNNGTILSVLSGYNEGEALLKFEVMDTISKAGTYQDTLTFTVSVDGIVDLISFTVKGSTYYAEEGMTWAEFVASDYNPEYYDCIHFGEDGEESGTKFTLDGTRVRIHSDYCEEGNLNVTLDDGDDTEVVANDEIIPNEAYIGTDQ